MKTVSLYDTTLRDGAQRRGISYSLEDKLKITRLLDRAGLHYIEGGWPGSNPKDCAYFERVRDEQLQFSKVSAFGSTRRASLGVEDDQNLRALLAAETPAVTVVGKSWTFHVSEVLATTLDENLLMITESIQWMKEHGREVIYDAEHFFDGYAADKSYALKTLEAAVHGGADTIVLCDTNGGRMPHEIAEIVTEVCRLNSTPVGIHTHNDCELAVANSLAAIQAGCVHVQGTVNGYGERCGNANLIAIVPNLQLKLGYSCVSDEALSGLTSLSRKVSEIANLMPNPHAAYVGSAAFAHKGGIHVAAVEKNPLSYEHIKPETIGNKRQFVISELSGRGNIRVRAGELGVETGGNEKAVLNKVKELESQGFQFENAEGSFELMLRKDAPDYQKPFELIDMLVVSEVRRGEMLAVEAMVKVKVGEEIFHTVADGDGPVHALDGALRKALLSSYPALADVRLVDYKVRILDPDKATAATTRVMLEAASGGDHWSTVGVSCNIVEASVQALCDSLELYLLRSVGQAAVNG